MGHNYDKEFLGEPFNVDNLITEARGVKSVIEQAAVARQTSEMQLLPEKQEYAGFVGGGTQ